MTAELHKLDCEPPTEGITELLEDMIEQNEAGKLSSLAFSVVYRDGTTGSGHSFMPSVSTMIGGVELLKEKLIRQVLG
ncbi:hypothetical protein HME9302_00025 [Alteripontixanthobacter maritimus]|uniref:Uncharacterized protein n=1 Tax=Alteripontixanthobacter maritimus TaxID=2161824 RepID=A0A369QPC1_9SPHN|nr:hypothetical protein [Alteripontixanthobacter maritimus]RDC59804.1 hypothetical protein HME9302_00999 [Alteripontixanthobacter maritimus]RDC66574.1 hypothetical protein HME9302_00025 [Alteripontixanthobacter maritimus]